MVGSKINELESNQLSNDFLEKIYAIQEFNFTNENVKWYYGVSRFNYNILENKFTWGNSEIIGDSVSNHLINAGAIKYEHRSTAQLFERLPSMLDSFILLDFVSCYEGNNNMVDLMKTESGIYVSRINNDTKISKFFKAKSATEAISYVLEQTGQDASTFLVEYLKEESSVLAEKASKILEFESMIVFLKEQRELLSNFDKSITKIKEADKVICDEIKIWEAKISQLSLDNDIV
jgi:hypothetical protein